MTTPRVSVLVPNYNHAPFLEKRLHSILSQTFQDFELIFLDDASTDGSVAVAERFARDYPLRILANQQNSGSPFVQWNKAVHHAKGEWIWIAESDDVAEPAFLERLTSILNDHPQVGLVYCASRRIDAEGNPGIRVEDKLKHLHETRWTKDFIEDGEEDCLLYMPRMNTIANASAVLFRKSVYKAVGGADESFRFCGDWDIWCRMLAESKVAFVSDALNQHRLHQGTVRSKSSQELAQSERAKVLLQLHARHDLPAEIRAEAVQDLIRKVVHHILQGKLSLRTALRIVHSLKSVRKGATRLFLKEYLVQLLTNSFRSRKNGLGS